MTIGDTEKLRIGEEVRVLDGLVGVVTSSPRHEQVWTGSGLVDSVVVDVHTIAGDEQADNNTLESI